MTNLHDEGGSGTHPADPVARNALRALFAELRDALGDVVEALGGLRLECPVDVHVPAANAPAFLPLGEHRDARYAADQPGAIVRRRVVAVDSSGEAMVWGRAGLERASSFSGFVGLEHPHEHSFVAALPAPPGWGVRWPADDAEVSTVVPLLGVTLDREGDWGRLVVLGPDSVWTVDAEGAELVRSDASPASLGPTP